MNIEYLKYFSELAKSRWKKSTEFRCFKKKDEM